MRADDEARRLLALEETALLDTPPEAAFDRLTRLAARLLEAPVALVSLVDDRRQFFKSAVGLALRETPLTHSFCRHVVRGGATVIIDDARRDDRVADNPAIDELGVHAYLGVPLRTPEGLSLGALCTIDHRPHAWTERDVEILNDLAAMVMDEVSLRVRSRRLERQTALLATILDTMAESVVVIDKHREPGANRGRIAGRQHAISRACQHMARNAAPLPASRLRQSVEVPCLPKGSPIPARTIDHA